MFNSISRWLTMAVERIGGRPKLEEAVVAQYITGRLRFAPYVEPREGETPQMRNSYRMLVKEPTVKSCLDSLIGGIASGELDVTPVSKSPRDVEVAQFCKDLIYNCDGGLVGLCSSVIGNGLIEGYSVTEPVWEIEDRGHWKGKSVLRKLKPKPTEDYWFEVDKFWNVTAIISRLTVEPFPVSDFVYWRHQNYSPSPHGTSLLRACYRSAWMLDTVWKLRGIGLERYTLPAMVAKYPMGNDPVRVSMEAAVRKIKAAGYATIPTEAMLEPLQMSLRGTSDFEAAVKDLKEEICIAMLGGSLQTLQGFTPGGRGSSAEHAGVMQTRIWMLTMAACELIYRQLFQQAVEWNYGKDTPVPHPVIGGVNDDDIKKSLDLDEQMQRMGYPVSIKGVSERTRRSPGDGDDILKPPGQGQQPGGGLAGMLGGAGGGGPSDGLFGPPDAGNKPPPKPPIPGVPQTDKPDQPAQPFAERQVVVVNHLPRPEYVSYGELSTPQLRKYSAADWAGPVHGPKGGTYWQNTKTGVKVYQKDNPGGGDGNKTHEADGTPTEHAPADSVVDKSDTVGFNGTQTEGQGNDATVEDKQNEKPKKDAPTIPEHLANPLPILPGLQPWGLKPYNLKGYTDKVEGLIDTIKQGTTSEGITQAAFEQAYEAMKTLKTNELYAFMALLGLKGNVKNERVAAYIKSKILGKIILKPSTAEGIEAIQELITSPATLNLEKIENIVSILEKMPPGTDLFPYGIPPGTPKEGISAAVFHQVANAKAHLKKMETAKKVKEKLESQPPAPPKATEGFAKSIADYKVDNSTKLGGSTGAKLAEYNGQKFILKTGKNAGHIKNEYHANKMYEAAGVAVPEVQLYDQDGVPTQAGKMVAGKSLGKWLDSASPSQREAMTKKIAANFVLDALLGNWDVIGSSRDNIIVTSDGVPVRIDNGGSLNYRAMGGLKSGSQWGWSVDELDSMRNPGVNAAAAAFFGHLTDDDIKSQIDGILSKRESIINAAPDDQKDTIKARLIYLQGWKPKPPVEKPKPIGVGVTDFLPDHVVRTKGELPPREITLDEPEKAALSYYCGSGYVPLNKGLRDIPPSISGTYEKMHKSLQSMFEKAKKTPLKAPMVVMRGVHIGSGYPGGQKMAGILEQASKEGGQVMLNGYTSTTVDPRVSTNFASGTGILMEIKTRYGVTAGSQGVSSEHEFLMGHGWQYRVVAKKQIFVRDEYHGKEKQMTCYQMEHIPDWEAQPEEKQPVKTAKPKKKAAAAPATQEASTAPVTPKKKAWTGVFN